MIGSEISLCFHASTSNTAAALIVRCCLFFHYMKRLTRIGQDVKKQNDVSAIYFSTLFGCRFKRRQKFSISVSYIQYDFALLSEALVWRLECVCKCPEGAAVQFENDIPSKQRDTSYKPEKHMVSFRSERGGHFKGFFYLNSIQFALKGPVCPD